MIGIGKTRLERIESLLALRELQQRYGHLQEIIVQNFRAKPGTKMAQAPEPDLEELLWTIAVTRIIFGPEMSIQAPPNLSPGVLPKLIDAGINDWRGVSPITPDFVNPEAPWPHVEKLSRESALAGKSLQQRLTIYPQYALKGEQWLDPQLQTPILQMIDSEGYARTDNWVPGQVAEAPEQQLLDIRTPVSGCSVAPELSRIVERDKQRLALNGQDILRLFQARGPEVAYV